MASKLGGLKINEWLQSRNKRRAEVAARRVVGCRLRHSGGKADALGEETGKSTSETAGIGAQASKEGFAEITSGRFY